MYTAAVPIVQQLFYIHQRKHELKVRDPFKSNGLICSALNVICCHSKPDQYHPHEHVDKFTAYVTDITN